MNYFVMSDIHGCYDEMIEALKSWNKHNEHLVVMGDLIDRGPDSLKVIRHLMKLKSENIDKVTVLMGNHEEMFLAWLTKTPIELFAEYYNEIHNETLQSFFGDKLKYQKTTRQQRGKHILYNFKYELNWLMDLPRSFETENIIFVHAGINLDGKDWQDDMDAMLSVRNEFIYSSKVAPKRVFFGHTPTQFIHSKDIEDKNDIWISLFGDKVGIDGGVCFGGQLNALKVDGKGEILEVIKVGAQWTGLSFSLKQIMGWKLW